MDYYQLFFVIIFNVEEFDLKQLIEMNDVMEFVRWYLPNLLAASNIIVKLNVQIFIRSPLKVKLNTFPLDLAG